MFTVSLCHQIGEAVGGNLKILLCCPFHFKLNVFSCSSFNWRVHAASPGAPPLELVRSSPFSDRLAELHFRVYCLVLQSLSPPTQMHQSGLVTLYTNAHLIWKHWLCTRQIAGDTSSSSSSASASASSASSASASSASSLVMVRFLSSSASSQSNGYLGLKLCLKFWLFAAGGLSNSRCRKLLNV